MKSKDMAIIIYSCRKNEGMWGIFLFFLKKYWSDCPYPVILLTDYKADDMSKYNFDDCIEIDSNWGEMLINALNKIDYPYVSLWMDDYLLCDYIDTKVIEDKLLLARQYNAANLRLIQSPRVAGVFERNNSLGYYLPGTAYCLSTQIGIWDVNFLKDFVNRDCSAWEFERKVSMNCKEIKQPLLATLDFVFPYEEGVRKGKWMDAGVKLCERNQIDISISGKRRMSNWDMTKVYLKGAIIDLNPDLVLKIQNLLSFK